MRRLQIMTRTNRQLRPWHAPYVYGSFWRTARKNAFGERPPVSSECPSCPLISKLNEVNILTCWYHWKYYQYLLFVELHELKLNEAFKLSLSGAPAHLNIRHNVRLSTLVNSSNCGKAAAALTCTKFETNYWQNYSMNENICINENGEWKKKISKIQKRLVECNLMCDPQPVSKLPKYAFWAACVCWVEGVDVMTSWFSRPTSRAQWPVRVRSSASKADGRAPRFAEAISSPQLLQSDPFT